VDGNPLRTIKRSVLPNTMELKKYLRTRGAPLPGMPAIDEGDEAMEMGVGEEGVDEPGGAGFRLLLQDKTRHVNRWVVADEGVRTWGNGWGYGRSYVGDDLLYPSLMRCKIVLVVMILMFCLCQMRIPWYICLELQPRPRCVAATAGWWISPGSTEPLFRPSSVSWCVKTATIIVTLTRLCRVLFPDVIAKPNLLGSTSHTHTHTCFLRTHQRGWGGFTCYTRLTLFPEFTLSDLKQPSLLSFSCPPLFQPFNPSSSKIAILHPYHWLAANCDPSHRILTFCLLYGI